MYSEYEHYRELEPEIEDNLDFLSKINTFISDEVETRVFAQLEDFQQRMREYNSMKIEIKQLKAEKFIDANVAERKEKEAYRKGLVEGRKNALGGFDKGEKLWVLFSSCKRENCPRCHGMKTITVQYENNELEITCNICNGRGHETDYIREAREGTIENFKFRTYGTDSTELQLDVLVDGERSATNYETFFKTKKECEKYIDSLNKKRN